MNKGIALVCFAVAFLASIAALNIVAAPSTVSSHAVPALVSEINTALANPSVTTITDARLAFGTTNCFFRVSGTQLQFVVTGLATNVIDSDITTP